MMMTPKLLTEAETAQYIGMSRPFLRRARMEGNREGHAPGLPWIKLGRSVRYCVDDLERWIERHRCQVPDQAS